MQTKYDNKGNKTVKNFNTCDPGQMCPMTIPSTDMSLVLSSYTLSTYNGHQRRELDLNYHWLNLPTWRKNDLEGMAWSGNWRVVDNTLYHEDDISYVGDSSLVVLDSDTAASYVDAGGIGWDAQLVNDNGIIDDMRGYSWVDIQRTDTVSSFTDQAYGKYCHTYGTSGTIGLAIDFFNVSFSGSSSHDDLGVSHSFN